MARIVILAPGTHGDVAPLAGLGTRLRDAGHQVCITGFERFSRYVTDAGLDFRPTGGVDPADLAASERGRAAQRPGARGTASAIRVAEQQMRQMVPAMRDAADGADIVLCTFGTVPLALPIAEARGVPCLLVPLQIAEPTREFGPTFLGGRDLGPWLNKAIPKLVGRLGTRAFAGLIRQVRSDLGLPPTLAPDYRPDAVPVLYGVSPTVVPRPADWRDNVRVAGYFWPPSPRDWRPSGELERFLADGPAPVYIGFGSLGVGKAGSLGQVVLDALARTGRRAVVQRGWADLDVTGDNILTIGEIPHDWLFPRVAVAVHHAGAGTTAAALRAGIPSVPVPFIQDQHFWARKLVALGTAPCSIPAGQLSGARLATAITRVGNDPRYGQAATAIAHDITQEDGAAVVLDTVERLVVA